jgi:beta-galactosidase
MAVREPNPDNGVLHETLWSVWPTWESWTWPGREGKPIQVEVYSKYPSVRLYLNDKLFGELPTTKAQEFKATFTLPYEPGVLKAVGVTENKEMEATRLNTAQAASAIRLKADRTILKADGQDLSFVEVELTDHSGTLQPNAELPLTFRVEGPGRIAGVDNAQLKGTEAYCSDTRTTWHGRAMVVIRSKHLPGTVKLTVSTPNLPDATLLLKTR